MDNNKNRDSLTGEKKSHPIGTGIGATAGGLAGAAVAGAVFGSVGGPVGAAAGAAAGAIAAGTAAGAVAGGMAGRNTAEAINPTQHKREEPIVEEYNQEGIRIRKTTANERQTIEDAVQKDDIEIPENHSR